MAWIAGENVTLRAWEREDIRTMWKAGQNADASGDRLRDWFEPPRSLADLESEYDAAFEDPAQRTSVRLIIQAGGRAIGDINFFEIDTRNRRAYVGLGIWSASDRGKGYGADALRAFLRWGFRHLNLHRVELGVDPDNAPALAIYKKLGFVEEGRRRQHHFDDATYHDELLMGLLAEDFTDHG